MALGEFQLIERFFSNGGAVRDDVVLGVGDDAAVVRVPAQHELVVAADTLVSGVHFPAQLDAWAVGYRALAVNLSDMAAMGAAPAWFTLALTLPQVEERWLAGFSRGLRDLAVRHGVALIGGDTTRGPLTVSVQILGLIPDGEAIRRSAAKVGEIICVSGSLGDAAAGLKITQKGVQERTGDERHLMQRFLEPTPRVALGLGLRGLVSAAIDVSDGLYADLGKLVAASGVGARLDIDGLPCSSALLSCVGKERATELALSGGDDYELCFTVPEQRMEQVQHVAAMQGEVIHRIGVVEALAGVRCHAAGRPVDMPFTGYDHFAP